jgi:hypothetical protein
VDDNPTAAISKWEWGMRPDSVTDGGSARRVGYPHGAVVRWVVAAAVAAIGGGLFAPGTAAEKAEPSSETLQAEASNGGVASATTGGSVEIGQIVTGENTGNSIATGDIVGPAELHGGETTSPVEITVTQEIGPPTVDASGGDGGTAQAETTDKDLDKDAARDNQNGDVTIINRNENQANATIET